MAVRGRPIAPDQNAPATMPVTINARPPRAFAGESLDPEYHAAHHRHAQQCRIQSRAWPCRVPGNRPHATRWPRPDRQVDQEQPRPRSDAEDIVARVGPPPPISTGPAHHSRCPARASRWIGRANQRGVHAHDEVAPPPWNTRATISPSGCARARNQRAQSEQREAREIDRRYPSRSPSAASGSSSTVIVN